MWLLGASKKSEFSKSVAGLLMTTTILEGPLLERHLFLQDRAEGCYVKVFVVSLEFDTKLHLSDIGEQVRQGLQETRTRRIRKDVVANTR